MSALGLTTSREIKQTLRGKAFWIVNAVLFVGATLAVILPSIINSGAGTDVVATVNTTPAMNALIREARGDTHVRFIDALDAADGKQLVHDGKADIAIVGGSEPAIFVQSGEHDALVAAAQQAIVTTTLETRLHDAGLSEDQAAHVLQVTPAHVEGLDKDAGARRGAAAIAATVLYILLLSLTISVANGVALEKSNRISEVLLAIVPPRPLLFGKVIGVGLMGIATLLFGIIPVAIRIATGSGLPAGMGAVLASGAAWFALGLAFYLVCAGSLAALVERPEQSGSAMSPLMGALIGSLIVAQSAPESALARILAYVPLSSPVVEPSRIAVGASSPAEAIGSLLLLIAALVFAVRVGGVVYQRAIVRTGRRLKLSEVLRAA
jgi:ABC-2 type transport system permease protein